jgi:hypothetical protein
LFFKNLPLLVFGRGFPPVCWGARQKHTRTQPQKAAENASADVKKNDTQGKNVVVRKNVLHSERKENKEKEKQKSA